MHPQWFKPSKKKPPPPPRRPPPPNQRPSVSSRESEVLARQRAVAAQLTGVTTGGAAAGGAVSLSSKGPPPPSTNDATLSAQQRLLAKSAQKRKLNAILRPSASVVKRPTTTQQKRPGGGGSSASSSTRAASGGGGGTKPAVISLVDYDDAKPTTAPVKSTQKRPAMRKSGSAGTRAALKKPTTAAAAVAAARNRLGIQKDLPPKLADDRTSSGGGVGKKDSAALKRAPMRNKSGGSGGGRGGSVASLLGAASSEALKSKPNVYEHYRSVEAEDFWKDLRNWDFVKDWNEHNAKSKRGGGGGGGNGKKKKGEDGKGKGSMGKGKGDWKKNLGKDQRKRPRTTEEQKKQLPPPPPPQPGTMVRSQSGRGYGTTAQKQTTNSPPQALDGVAEKEAAASIENGDKKKVDQRDRESSDNGGAAPIPDVFTSYRQYMSLWSPLCLAESRAQLLSEVSSDVPYWSKPGKGPIMVSVTPLKKDISGGSDWITVQIQPKGTDGWNLNGGGGRDNNGFFANDIVLLTREKSSIVDASKGTLPDPSSQRDDYTDGSSSLISVSGDPSSPSHKRRKGLVGHTEHSRRSLDGLQLKVSRKLWPAVGAPTMVLLKLGSNVTALREYTALCRVDTIPLLNYLLGRELGHTAKKKGESSPDGAGSKGGTDKSSSSSSVAEPGPKKGEETEKAIMLKTMGGVSALGKGFTKYAQKKFNPSQLGAISAAAAEYGDGGFTLVKGPPGTGKTTTLVALLNSLHIRQFNKYYEEVRRIAALTDVGGGKKKVALGIAAKAKPRLLVCAPSNAAVDNVILKIMEDGFVDGNGARYNPQIVRVGVGQGAAVKDVGLEAKVENLISEGRDVAKLDSSVAGYKMELQRVQGDITRLRRRVHALANAAPWPLSKDWEIRIDEETFETTGRVYFVNHREKTTSFECPPPPEPDEKHFPSTAMPEYRSHTAQVVKLVERYNSITSKLERCTLVQSVAASLTGKGGGGASSQVRQSLETHILDSAHIVLTTLGTAGNRALESAAKFEVVVVDEAAQSVEPATLVALQLGSSHAILVGDPQQLPATIFSVSGRNTKYDRSLFQRLEEAGHEVHLLNTQYRMHPAISDFPRRIFYGGNLLDGPNVKHPEYGNPLRRTVLTKFQAFQPFTILDLDSSEERGGTSLANSAEANLAVHLYSSLRTETSGLSSQSRVAVITPYAQQAALLRRVFSQHLGSDYTSCVEVNTVDAFQGREANIVIFSCVRAAGSRGIGFLSDVRRMNVALTRAKHFLFVLARCKSIVVNPYWRDLVAHARETNAVIPVPILAGDGNGNGGGSKTTFPDLKSLKALPPPAKAIVPVKRKRVVANKEEDGEDSDEDGEIA